MAEKKVKDNKDISDSKFVEDVVTDAEVSQSVESDVDFGDGDITEEDVKERFSDYENSDDDYFLMKLVVFVLIVVLGFFAIYFFMGGSFNSNVMSSSNVSDLNVGSSDVVLAVVAGENIYQSDIDKYYSVVPDYMKSVITKDVLLNQTIEAKLLIKEGKALGLSVSDADVESQIKEVMASTGLTEDQLINQLKEKGLTLDDLKSDYKDKLLVDKVVTQEVVSKVSVSDAEVKDLYDKYVSEGVINDVVTVKHILVSGVNDSSKDKIELVKSKYESGEDFCDLVKEYSEDPGSVTNCGEYTFPRGQMVSEFENLSFSLKSGETGIVKTQYGYHFILGVEPEHIPSYEDSKDALYKELVSQESQKYYISYIESLKDKYGVKILSDVKKNDMTLSGVEKVNDKSDDVVVIDFFFSESNDKSMLIKSELESLASEFGSSVVLNLWCVPVSVGDKDVCISKYGKDNFDKGMSLVKDKSVKGVPYLYFNDDLFLSKDRSKSNLKKSICERLSSNPLC